VFIHGTGSISWLEAGSVIVTLTRRLYYEVANAFRFVAEKYRLRC
jgi:hypothetical protein